MVYVAPKWNIWVETPLKVIQYLTFAQNTCLNDLRSIFKQFFALSSLIFWKILYGL